jgi:hypothetical protein
MKNDKQYFLDKPRNVKRLIQGFYGCCVVLFVLDFVIHRHSSHSWENLWGFYALYGFGSCVVLVLLAKQMRKFLMRHENYYDAAASEHQQATGTTENPTTEKGEHDVDA